MDYIKQNDIIYNINGGPSSHLRRDRYNKKLKKYYVVYQEDEEELSEDEERREHTTNEALLTSAHQLVISKPL